MIRWIFNTSCHVYSALLHRNIWPIFDFHMSVGVPGGGATRRSALAESTEIVCRFLSKYFVALVSHPPNSDPPFPNSWRCCALHVKWGTTDVEDLSTWRARTPVPLPQEGRCWINSIPSIRLLHNVFIHCCTNANTISFRDSGTYR